VLPLPLEAVLPLPLAAFFVAHLSLVALSVNKKNKC
jgi:hypothetical protein